MAEPAPRRIEYRCLSDLVPAPVNPKRHDLPSLSKSIARFGIIDPIVQDGRTGRLISGHGRMETLAQAEASGLAPPDGVRVVSGTWRVPVVTGWASANDREAAAALVAVNRLTTTGGWDDAELSSLLASLAVDEGLAGVGFSDAEIADLLASVEEPDAAMPVPGDERYTPAWVFEGMGLEFDMDVAAPVDASARSTPARRFLTIHDDGLASPWEGLVWMNPPYSAATPWARKWTQHPDGVCLLCVSQSTWMPELVEAADCFVFTPGVRFTEPDGHKEAIGFPIFMASCGSGTVGLERLAAAHNWPLCTAGHRPRPDAPMSFRGIADA